MNEEQIFYFKGGLFMTIMGAVIWLMFSLANLLFHFLGMPEVETAFTNRIVLIMVSTVWIVSILCILAFHNVEKVACLYCGKRLGKDYFRGKSMYKQKNMLSDVWAHQFCVPKKDKKYWRHTR